MRGLLALVLSGMATVACAEPQAQTYTLAGLFREACIDTDMDRASIAALAASKGWRPLPFDPGEDGPDWGDGYMLDGARVMLVGEGESEPPAGPPPDPSLIPVVIAGRTTCAVDFRDEPANWREDAEATARTMNFTEYDLPSEDPGIQRAWVQGLDALLISRRDPSTGVIGLEIIRIDDLDVPSGESTGD